jgi:hypothetical protein
MHVGIAVSNRLAASHRAPTGLSIWRLGPPDGVAGRCGLPGGAGHVGGDDVGRVPVQAAAGPLVPHGGSRVSVGGGLLNVAQRDAGVEGGGDECVPAAGTWYEVNLQRSTPDRRIGVRRVSPGGGGGSAQNDRVRMLDAQ